jgi:uncharacterized integral membrane protein
MQFLKTLFWVALAIILVLFGSVNWHSVTVNLWGGLAADIKLPVLILLAFLIGFLPTFILLRTKIWSLKRRLDLIARNAGTAPAVPASPNPAATRAAGEGPGDRVATDSKVWPAE